MAAQTKRELYLQVSANIDGMTSAMKAGRTALLSLGAAAGEAQAEVNKAAADMASGSIKDSAQGLVKSYERTFAEIKRSARAAADAPTPAMALTIIDAAGARQAADAAEHQAVALRLVAEAASRAEVATTGDAAAAHAVAYASAAAANAADEHAQALRSQAGVLTNVETEVRSLAQAQGLTDGGLRKTTVVSGQARAGMQQLSYQMSDVATQFASGTSASIIFAQQSGQVIQALQLMTTKTSGFLGFLGGPWGLALSSATVLLAPFIGKLFDTGEAADKAKNSTFDFTTVLDTRRLSVNQFSEAVSQLDTATKGLIQTQALLADNQLATARGEEADARARLAEIDRKIGVAQARVARSGPISEFIGLSGEHQDALRAKAELAGLEADKRKIQGDLPGIATATARAQIAITQRQVREGLDLSTKLLGQLDRSEARLTARRLASAAIEAEAARGGVPMGGGTKTPRGYISEADYEKQLTKGRSDYNAKVQAAQDAKSKTSRAASQFERDNRQTGRTVTPSEAAAIVRGIGGQVNSSTRTYAEQKALYDDPKVNRPGNPVARPGTSAHESGRALDVQMTPGMSLAKIREAFRAEGVSLTKTIVERGHFHVEFGKVGKKGPSVETVAKREERERVKPFDQERAFQGELGTAQSRLARAQLALVDTAEERFKVEVEELDAARAQRDIQIKDAYESGKYGDVGSKIALARSGQLTALNASTTAAEKQAATDRGRQSVLDRHLSIDRAEINDKMALMNAQASLATTAEARRRVALQLLAEEEKLLRIEANRKIANDNPATQADGRRELAQVDALHPYRVEQTKRDTADPLEQYGRRLIDATSNMDAAFKGVKADGLQALEDGLMGVISGTETVAGAFKKMASAIIADLARIAIEKAIVGVLGKSFFGFSDGGPVGIQKHADGGFIRGAGNATSDSILSWLSNGEFVINAASTRRHLPLLKAINDNQLPGFATGGLASIASLSYPALPKASALRADRGDGPPVHFDLRGAVMTEDLLMQMQAMASASGRAAAVAGANLAGSRAAVQAGRRFA